MKILARLLASRLARKGAEETWRTTTLADPPDRDEAPLPRVLAWTVLVTSAVAVAQVLVQRHFARGDRADG